MSATAAIYARISLDKESEERGVKRQREDCEALAAKLGLSVVETFTDNDIGASTRSTPKPRKGYNEMLRRARRGDFSTILAYSNSRLTRRPMEFEDLISLHEEHGVRVVTCVSGADDLSTADGRMTARIKASVDAAEAERIAERVARKRLESAREGRLWGRRAFGWEEDGRLRPSEALVAREVAQRLLAGEATAALARELNERGVKTAQGNKWTTRTLKQYLINPRLAGWQVHRGEVLLDGSGMPLRGSWEPILAPEVHEALCEALKPSHGPRRRQRDGARRYLLSGIVKCGICGGPMYGNRRGEKHYYMCKGEGHSLSIAGGPLDDMIRDLLLKATEGVEAEGADEPFPQEGELGDLDRRIAETMDAFARGDLSGDLAFPLVSRLRDEREDIKKHRADWVMSSGPVLQLSPESWIVANLSTRRAFVRSLVEALLIRPVNQRSNHFQPERVSLVPKSGRWSGNAEGLNGTSGTPPASP